ncbi:pilus assembly protein PilO [Solimonas sp. K1W22B-7]|uniref:type 4a pilus biogenesis protein PilO n=1 Tax=Solimonas sp. K1W22B-7 TaxID=2303331 RepID=UPI000E337B84|nr:type 4a pilus biogenesis protein PilO [Solimonas sp. K1W22B-7]AXQ27288.1 pilus assembly protein PilO [Solimonas sp. K1W22B-7]
MNFQEAITELQTLDTSNPGAWPMWVRVSASVLAGVVVLGLGIYLLVKPVYEELTAAEATELQLRQKFEENQGKAAALESYKAQLAEMEQNFGAMLKQLPSKAEVPNLLNDISQARVSASLEEELFKPQDPVPKEFYAEIPNKVIVTGTYHELANFVSAVAALPRIVTIEDVEINLPAESEMRGKGALDEGTLRMTALAKTYRYLDDDEIAAAEADKTKTGAAK